MALSNDPGSLLQEFVSATGTGKKKRAERTRGTYDFSNGLNHRDGCVCIVLLVFFLHLISIHAAAADCNFKWGQAM